MIEINTALAGREMPYGSAFTQMETVGFHLGGNWDYGHGSFDSALDEQRTLWLRLPFEVVQGKLEGETPHSNARIRFGQAYVLRHLYQNGIDSDGGFQIVGALVNQFQAPLDPDAALKEEWVQLGRERALIAEQALQGIVE